VICTVRSPNESLFSCVPQVSIIPPHLAGPTAPGYFWVRYEATFPDDFPITAGTRLEAGSSRVVWGTAPAGRPGAHIISSTTFTLDQPIEIRA
jgi:hypothetical protein